MDDNEKKLPEYAERGAYHAIRAARRAGIVRREEQDRVADWIEMALFECKEQETADLLVRLAQHILDPVRRT